MKKQVFAIIAGFCSIAGLSSFRRAHRTFYESHYFHVRSGFGFFDKFRNTMVEGGSTKETEMMIYACNDGPNRCVVAFTEAQITHTSAGSTILRTDGNNRQTIATTIYTRLSI